MQNYARCKTGRSVLINSLFYILVIVCTNWHELRDQLDEGHVGAACNTLGQLA